MSGEALEIDGPNRPFNDDLLDGLVGGWKVTGKIAGQSIMHSCEAAWVLKHQFLRVHFVDVDPKRSQQQRKDQKNQHAPYEAMVFIGYDNMSERYVVHWLDIFGGRFSETLGFGARKDSLSIEFVFEYPSGPLRNTFRTNQDKTTWSIMIEQKDDKGMWTIFADQVLERV